MKPKLLHSYNHLQTAAYLGKVALDGSAVKGSLVQTDAGPSGGTRKVKYDSGSSKSFQV